MKVILMGKNNLFINKIQAQHGNNKDFRGG